jgi:hypothetical protein
MERIIRQGTLGFVQETGEVFGYLAEGSFAASQTSLWSVVMKSHGGTPLLRGNDQHTRVIREQTLPYFSLGDGGKNFL